MLFLLLISMILSIPAIQTKLGHYATNKINENFGINLNIERVDFSFLGSVQLKGVQIRDHHKDTLIFAKNVSTSILNAKRFLDNEVNLKSISLDGVDFKMKTYKGEEDVNMSIFIASFDTGKPNDSLNPFILRTSNLYLNDLNFKLINANRIDSILYAVKNAGGNLQKLEIVGPNFSSNIRGLYFVDKYGLEVTNLTTNFGYSKTAMHFKETTLQTKNTDIKGDIDFNYKREDLANFNDKVKIKAKFNASKVAVQDVKKFYNELSGNDILDFNGNLEGTINSFDLNKLKLYSKEGIKIEGNLSFVNAVSQERGFVFEGNLKTLSATYQNLKNILPNVLGNNLPSEFNKLGVFDLKGYIRVTPDQIQAEIEIKSQIGSAISDLQITNIDNIDYAVYDGVIQLTDFNIGTFFNDPLFGTVSLKGKVKGSGFKLDNINTAFNGKISKIKFKGYPYKNIVANGQYQNNKFDGDITIDDENFKMNFNGLADLSSEVRKFDFKTNISYLNLKKTNLFVRDSIAELKGIVELDIEGNTFDDIVGQAIFKNVFYTNQKKRISL